MTSKRMPAELLNEMFGALQLDNAFGLLVKMPNDLLARNIQKMINGIKEAMKNNKLNVDDCGKLEISDGGLVAKHSGPNEANCVRTILPIPKLNGIKKRIISFYFEVEILKKLTLTPHVIGFCDQQFPLEDGWLGCNKNSIGIWPNGVVWIDYTCRIRFGNGYREFEKGDVIDLGIIQRPNSERKFFATLNGKLLGMLELPSTFLNVRPPFSDSLYALWW